MLLKSCAGGLVFWGEKILLLKDSTDKWTFPKETVSKGDYIDETALFGVRKVAGITADIISTAGHISYDFDSFTRNSPICRRNTWYIMKARDGAVRINKSKGYKDGGYYSFDEAMRLLTRSQDKALLNLFYRTFKELMVHKAAV